MSTPGLILGESGTGKSYSLRNLDPSKTLLIQAIAKPVPWKGAKAAGWKPFESTTKSGNIFVTDKAGEILALMQGTKRKIIVIDDFQYVLANELMRRYRETGYGKFSEVGYNGWNLVTTASTLPSDVRIYFLAHTMTGDDGITRLKTPGKLLDTYSVEGMFSLVLRTSVRDGEYFFATKNSGSDTVKAPVGMFEAEMIPNDLAFVDEAIINFGW
jgi:hypothetical protein